MRTIQSRAPSRRSRSLPWWEMPPPRLGTKIPQPGPTGLCLRNHSAKPHVFLRRDETSLKAHRPNRPVLSPRGGDSVTSGRSINHLFRSSGHDGGRAGLLPSSLVQPGPPLSQPASGGSSISSDFSADLLARLLRLPGILVIDCIMSCTGPS
jgi:hypothetical protein